MNRLIKPTLCIILFFWQISVIAQEGLMNLIKDTGYIGGNLHA
jgi:hypothetical protein